MGTIPKHLAVCVGAATLALLASCTPPSESPDPEAPTTLTVAATFDTLYIDEWNPLAGGVGGEYLSWQAVYDTLVVWEPDTQTFQPWLAEEVSFHDDRRGMTFVLRDDVVFRDGTAMDAPGVEAYFDALLASDALTFLGTIAGYDVEFTALDDRTLELTTSRPIYAPDLWILLGWEPVLSPALIDDPEGSANGAYGSGPYILEESVPEVEATFVRNPDYWNPEAFPFDSVVVKVLADPVAKLNALKSGQITASVLALPQVAEAEASGLALNRGGGSFRALMIRDPENSTLPALTDIRVRQAIALAFDREAIAETIDLGYGDPSSQPFIPAQAEYVEGGDDRYAYDLDRARELMADAGYADGFDVSIPVYPDSAPLQPIVQQSLGDIGIRVTFEPSLPGRFEWFTASTSGDYPLTLEPLLLNANYLRWLAEEFSGLGRLMEPGDELLGLIETLKWGSPEESATASGEFGELLLEEALYIPISRPATFWGSDPAISVHVSEALGLPRLLDFQLSE